MLTVYRNDTVAKYYLPFTVVDERWLVTYTVHHEDEGYNPTVYLDLGSKCCGVMIVRGTPQSGNLFECYDCRKLSRPMFREVFQLPVTRESDGIMFTEHAEQRLEKAVRSRTNDEYDTLLAVAELKAAIVSGFIDIALPTLERLREEENE